MKKTLTTVQIVDVSEGKEKHVKKISLTLKPENVLWQIEKMFRGHLVGGKIDPEPPQIGEENDVQGKSRGKGKKGSEESE